MKQTFISLLLTTLLVVAARGEVEVGAIATKGDMGVLVMAHGGDASWNRLVEEAVAPLPQKYPVEVAFGMAERSTIKAAVERLEARGAHRIAVVRLFVSGDSFLEHTRYILGLEDAPAHVLHQHSSHSAHHQSANDDQGHGHGGGHAMEPPLPIGTKCRFYLSEEGLAASPLLDEILVDRVRALSTNPSQESVLVLAHGPADEAENERWLAQMRLRAQGIHSLGPFRHVECETLREDWPERRRYAEARIRRYVEDASADGGRVIVVPFRVAQFGDFAEVLEGLDYVADGRGFLPHPNITRWIEETADTCLARAASSDQAE